MEIVLGVIAFGVSIIALLVAVSANKSLRDQLGRVNKNANVLNKLVENHPELFVD